MDFLESIERDKGVRVWMGQIVDSRQCIYKDGMKAVMLREHLEGDVLLYLP